LFLSFDILQNNKQDNLVSTTPLKNVSNNITIDLSANAVNAYGDSTATNLNSS
jgi:hypothetical protein